MKQKLFKSSTDKRIMGVCGGLGEYFNIDPTIIRVIVLFLFFYYSVGFWIYLAMGIVLPYDYQVKSTQGKRISPLFMNNIKRNESHNRKDVTPESDDRWSDF